MNYADDLLSVESWPDSTRQSAHFPLLKQAAALSIDLDTLVSGGADIDERLHQVFSGFDKAVPWIPNVQSGPAPAYTRAMWDLRSLVAMIPGDLELGIKQESRADEEGLSRWEASLFDGKNTIHVAHPSHLEHNKVLNYDSSTLGVGWTPNNALARILLAAFILGFIQQIEVAAAAEIQSRLNQKCLGGEWA